MTHESMRFRLGLFVLAALVLLGVLIILFGSYPTFLFKKPNTYTVYFDNAPGVDAGTPVRRSGVHIGEVSRVELDSETGRVKVTIAIDTKYTIYQDDKPVLKVSVLGGDTTIDFVAATPRVAAQHIPVPPGTELEGERQDDVMSILANVVPRTTESLNRLSKTMERVEQILPTAETTMKEFNKILPTADSSLREFGKLSEKTGDLISDLRDTNREIQGVAKDVHNMVPDVKRTNDEMLLASRNFGKLAERTDVLLQANQDKIVRIIDQASDNLSRLAALLSDENQKNVAGILKNARASTDHLDDMIRTTEDLLKDSQKLVKQITGTVQQSDEVIRNLQKATKPMAERSESVMRNLDESTDKFNRMITDIQNLLRGVPAGNGTLAKLLKDPSLYNHLDEAACAAAKIMPQLQYIVKDLETFSDKLARHPELIGVGGAVRPSVGIKDANPVTPILGPPR
jgi:phospholipid/cholesterol/gamma-HCH transport system substrate-binding protein